MNPLYQISGWFLYQLEKLLANPSFLLLILIMILMAWLFAVGMLVKEYGRKCGPDEHRDAFMLWFIGLFASPIVAGLIVCAHPDRSCDSLKASDVPHTEDQLPSI